jgi:hypothetical protein
MSEQLKWKDLIELPINSVFYEDDLPTEPLFAKVGDCSGTFSGKDIRVIPIHGDDGASRLGLFEMDDCTRNSKRWKCLTETELNTAIGRLMLANPASERTHRKEEG